MGSEGAQHFIAVLVTYNLYTTLKGWSSIPVRSYKGMSNPIAMICLTNSNMLKINNIYTVLTTYPCYDEHIF